ncbi:MAG: sulfatase [Planctomycetota bacterium]
MSQRPRALVRTLRVAGLALLLLTLANLAFWRCTSGDGEDELDRPNILLISIDTLRPDHMGAYGYDKPTTPRLDAFAREGVVFQNVFAPRGSTWPSLTSLMTGKFPINHGVRTNGFLMAANQVTLPEILRRSGYSTGAFLSNFYDAPARGWDRHVAETNPMQPHKVWDRKNVDRALEWMAEKKDQRTFTWVHLMDPHRPYDPLPEELSRFSGSYSGWLAPFVPLAELRAMAGEGRVPFDEAILDQYLSLRDPATNQTRAHFVQSSALRGNVPLDFLMEMITLFEIEISEDDLAYIVANYDAQIPPADALLGEVLDKLDELGLKDDTLVIFTTDHGDDLFEHNRYFFHGSSIYDSTLKVAWMMRWPGMIPAGRVIEGPLARNIDILPTILDLVGISSPRNIDGVSAAPLAMGTGSYEPGPVVIEWEDIIYSERGNDWSFVNNRQNARIKTPPFHLVGVERAYEIAPEELYDLRKDAGQQHNLLRLEDAAIDPEAGDRFAAIESLLQRLRTARTQDDRLLVWLEEQYRKPRPGGELGDEDIQDKMRQLGYVQNGAVRRERTGPSFAGRVLDLVQDLFDGEPEPSARHFALLAETQWLAGLKDEAERTVESGRAKFPDDKSLETLKRQIR